MNYSNIFGIIWGIGIGFILLMLMLLCGCSTNKAIPTLQTPKQEVKKTSCLFTLTAYCPGACCNGKWAGTTAIGKPMSYFLDRNINICAVDPRVIPLYSKIIYDGKVYLCVDTGGAIKGRRIDILFPTHEEATKFGVKRNVKIVRVK